MDLTRQRRILDTFLAATLRAAAVASGAIVVLIVGFLGHAAWPAWETIGLRAWVDDPSWHPLEGAYNATHLAVASVAVMIGALLLATPLALTVALFCQSYAPRALATLCRRVLELLAGIPSVVYGFWGLVVLVPLIGHWSPPGAGLFAGVLILAVMILPTVALLSEAAFARVRASSMQGAAALGLGNWATFWRVVLPEARGGVATALLLAAGRAIGETMAVLMVCGNVVQLPTSITTPVRTLTANIALEMGYAHGTHRAALFVTALLLMLIVGTLVFAAAWIGRSAVREEGGTHA